MNVDVTFLSIPAMGTFPLEIVERKGVGHPDTICDALAENLSIAVSRFYLERPGMVTLLGRLFARAHLKSNSRAAKVQPNQLPLPYRSTIMSQRMTC